MFPGWSLCNRGQCLPYNPKLSICLTSGDIVECPRVGVQERIQKPERALSSRDQLVVDQRNDTGKDGSRATRAVNEFSFTIDDNLEVRPNGGDIWIGTSRSVELARVGVAQSGEEALDGGCLVGGDAIVVGETTGGEKCRCLAFGARKLSCTHAGDASEGY